MRSPDLWDLCDPKISGEVQGDLAPVGVEIAAGIIAMVDSVRGLLAMCWLGCLGYGAYYYFRYGTMPPEARHLVALAVIALIIGAVLYPFSGEYRSGRANAAIPSSGTAPIDTSGTTLTTKATSKTALSTWQFCCLIGAGFAAFWWFGILENAPGELIAFAKDDVWGLAVGFGLVAMPIALIALFTRFVFGQRLFRYVVLAVAAVFAFVWYLTENLAAERHDREFMRAKRELAASGRGLWRTLNPQ